MTDVVAIQPKKSWLKKWWPYFVAVVVIIIAVAGTWWYVHGINNDNPPATGSNTNIDQATADQLSNLQDEALYGDANKALQGYDSALQSTTDQAAKRNLLLGKAMTADQAGQYDLALSSAQAADAIKSDYRSLATIALIYADQGNNAKAAEYYTKAANDPSESNTDAYAYRQEAARLAGQQ